MDRLVINSDIFLECAGKCVGCFLTKEERVEDSFFISNIKKSLFTLSEKYKNITIKELVIGFGRGNLLLLKKETQKDLVELMRWCENNFNYHNIVFEVSTSLIGKLDVQIESANYLLSKNKNIYFNIIVNSELSSQRFWENIENFYINNKLIREGWGLSNTGDIIVLSVNPDKLPNFMFDSRFLKNIKSPLNIALFPFSNRFKEKNVIQLQQWIHRFVKEFNDSDVNIQNYIESYNKTFTGTKLIDVVDHMKKTQDIYYFITKKGDIVNGFTSIMGEVDQIRLLEKYNLTLNIKKIIIDMNKNKLCQKCEYQKPCAVSGAYLNQMANEKMYEGKDMCLSGYKDFFRTYLT